MGKDDENTYMFIRSFKTVNNNLTVCAVLFVECKYKNSG